MDGNDKIFDGDAPKYPERAANPNYIPAEAMAVYAGPPTPGPTMAEQMKMHAQDGYDMRNPVPIGFVYAGPAQLQHPAMMVYAGPGNMSQAGFMVSGKDMISEAAKERNKELRLPPPLMNKRLLWQPN